MFFHLVLVTLMVNVLAAMKKFYAGDLHDVLALMAKLLVLSVVQSLIVAMLHQVLTIVTVFRHLCVIRLEKIAWAVHHLCVSFSNVHVHCQNGLEAAKRRKKSADFFDALFLRMSVMSKSVLAMAILSDVTKLVLRRVQLVLLRVCSGELSFANYLVDLAMAMLSMSLTAREKLLKQTECYQHHHEAGFLHDASVPSFAMASSSSAVKVLVLLLAKPMLSSCVQMVLPQLIPWS
jgi:hypothetical protein